MNVGGTSEDGPLRRRAGRRWWAAGLILCGVLAATAWWLATGEVDVRIESAPSNGAAFVDDVFVGQTPVLVRGLGFGPHHLLVKRRGCEPYRGVLQARLLEPRWWNRVRAVALRRPFVCTVELHTAATGVLVVSSQPEGAEVYLDGQLVGTTPLRLDDVRAGPHEVRFVKTGYGAATAGVMVSGERVAVERKLPSLMVEVLRQRIAVDPRDLHDYTDLAHQHVVLGEHAEALRVLQGGYKLIKESRYRVGADEDQRPDVRFFSECWKIYCREIKYPEEGSKALRTGVMALMQQASRDNPSDQTITGTLNRMLKYDQGF